MVVEGGKLGVFKCSDEGRMVNSEFTIQLDELSSHNPQWHKLSSVKSQASLTNPEWDPDVKTWQEHDCEQSLVLLENNHTKGGKSDVISTFHRATCPLLW